MRVAGYSTMHVGGYSAMHVAGYSAIVAGSNADYR